VSRKDLVLPGAFIRLLGLASWAMHPHYISDFSVWLLLCQFGMGALWHVHRWKPPLFSNCKYL